MCKVRVRSLAFMFLLLLCACASGGGAARAPADRNRITREELQATGYVNAYMAVEALRPQWLKPRGASSIYQNETIKVYLDDMLLGGPDYLKQITSSSIATLRFLDGLAASERWGLDHGQGAIVVSTRPGRSPA